MNVLLGGILNQHMGFIFFFLALGGHEYQQKLLHELLHQFLLHQCLLSVFKHELQMVA